MRKTRTVFRMAPLFLSGLLMAAVVSSNAVSQAQEEPSKQIRRVEDAAEALQHFLSDPDMAWFRDNLKEAKGVMIIPELVKAGLVVGSSGGNGILLVHDEKTGQWSEPAFYTLGSVSIGFQIGFKASEVIMMIMTPKGLKPLHGSSFKLGGEASVAAGPVGVGAEGATSANLSADYLSFARSKGVFAGISLEGAVVYADNAANSAYYAQKVVAADIIVSRRVSNPHSAKLKEILSKAAP